ncbi:MAG: histidine kinase [Treponema sp.]|nr:histidine kinase [Treponema sp.]
MNNFLKNLNLRTSLMLSVLASFVLTLFIVLYLSTLVMGVMWQTGNSFSTNAELDAYLTNLEQTEAAMESYMSYRTFESIDKYYHFEAAAESGAEKLRSVPSTVYNEQKEYTIKMLSDSFFALSNKAIAARRANNSKDADLYYIKTLDCYSFLYDEIMNLNMLYFKMNAANYNQSNAKTQQIIHRTIFAVIMILLNTALLLYIHIAHITTPLKQISSVALRVAERDFDVPLFQNKRKNEIGNICRAFDSMIISIREYVDTIWEKALHENELREKEIEMRALYTDAHLKALQDQIKPHFLFNTLNTGAQLAMMEGADKTCYFLEQVADFLRYNIQHPGSDATISEELGMLDNYIYIMKVRFGERYEFVKDIDESTLSVKMPNMILQPLVENCIKHGLNGVSENGRITISVKKQEDLILISISDNGIGFDKGVKERVMKIAQEESGGVLVQDKAMQEKAHVSTGLINVISRLQIYFKRTDVFSISENPDGCGTMFNIKIPSQIQIGENRV